MAYVVTFEDYLPSARYDGVPWTQAKIEESSSATGPWTLLETIILSPTDVDPAHPAVRDFTTDQATLETGWYRITFLDNFANAQPTEPVQNRGAIVDYEPSVAQVAYLLRSYTKDKYGNELGTFTENTRPTSAQVEELIERATDDVYSKILALSQQATLPTNLYGAMSDVIALRAVLMIALSFWPEQVQSEKIPYDEWKTLYDEAQANLISTMTVATEGEVVVSAKTPQWGFPPAYDYGSRPGKDGGYIGRSGSW